ADYYYPGAYGGYYPYRYEYSPDNDSKVMSESDKCNNSDMTLSALNQFSGVITSVNVTGVVGEVQVDLGCNHLASAIITAASIRNLNLRPGSRVDVVFIATAVMIRKQGADSGFSARNRFSGTVTQIKKGDILGKVVVDIGCGHIVSAIIPTTSIDNLCIKAGSKVSTDIKATEVMIMSRN
ncbi:TOBE domain-containing protein, partial [Clostridium sp.]